MVRIRLVIVAAVLAAASVTAAVLAATGSSSGPTRAQEQRFEAAVAPLVTDGGRVVEQGMKPALHDLTTDHVTPPAFIATEATQWRATLSRIGTQLAGVRASGQLARARARLVAALGMYADAAAQFRSAALATGAEREQLIDRGIATAKRGTRRMTRGRQSCRPYVDRSGSARAQPSRTRVMSRPARQACALAVAALALSACGGHAAAPRLAAAPGGAAPGGAPAVVNAGGTTAPGPGTGAGSSAPKNTGTAGRGSAGPTGGSPTPTASATHREVPLDARCRRPA